MITIIVPCYNEQETIPRFYIELNRVTEMMTGIVFDILFINDGSKDDTLAEIKDLHAKDSRVRYISFSRNFGKEAAIYAGLQHSRGEYIAIIDADLQDPPALLPEMYRLIAEEGYDSVATRRVTR
ncbi:MAG: glycosyltransferase family 2 protein, partial [Prevotella sp.]|nr:glycosyltransferase family 2 protein [Prevotella sp.]